MDIYNIIVLHCIKSLSSILWSIDGYNQFIGI